MHRHLRAWRVGLALALVALVYGYVRLMNPDWPVVADESWRPLLEFLSWPGLWIVTILVVLGILNIHGEAIELVQWGSSFLVYSGLLYVIIEVGTAVLAPAIRRLILKDTIGPRPKSS